MAMAVQQKMPLCIHGRRRPFSDESRIINNWLLVEISMQFLRFARYGKYLMVRQ